MPTFMPCKNKIKLHHHAKEANCTPLRQEVTQSHAEDLRDLLHGMHPGCTDYLRHSTITIIIPTS